MKNVYVEKLDLLKIVRRNRDAHRKFFLRAQKGYRRQWIKKLDQALKEARTGCPIQTQFLHMTQPQDHTSDYDRVIEMLEMSVDANIELDSQSFDRYVRDNWEWSRMALVANTMYAHP